MPMTGYYKALCTIIPLLPNRVLLTMIQVADANTKQVPAQFTKVLKDELFHRATRRV